MSEIYTIPAVKCRYCKTLHEAASLSYVSIDGIISIGQIHHIIGHPQNVESANQTICCFDCIQEFVNEIKNAVDDAKHKGVPFN